MVMLNGEQVDKKLFSDNGKIHKLYHGEILMFPKNDAPIPPEPTSFKWRATYSDGYIESAECDASSAITENEIDTTDLVSVVIGDCVTSIDDSAFYRCTSLTSVTIGNNVTTIGEYAFVSCTGLTSVTIPNSVTSIDYGAFCNCSGLTSVIIGSGVTSIGDSAFEECTSLTSVTIGNNVTTIGEFTFSGCHSLTSVTIPNSVETIGKGALYNCTSLTSVTIGNNVTTIGKFTFGGCSGLTSVTVEAVTPPTLGESVFDNTNNCPIYVPCDSFDTYKAADGWSEYSDRIQRIFPCAGTGW